MVEVIPARNRRFADWGWLKTYWLFSFADYYDPKNTHWGKLLVFNDDTVHPHQGFDTHPHEEMEIVTLVLSGELTHKDSSGGGLIRPGDVQRMSAGTGVRHSEYNHGSEPVHLYQIWIIPDKRGLEPSYEQRHFAPSAWRNRLFAIASGQGKAGAVTLHTDATIYRGALDEGSQLEFETHRDRRIFIYLTEGELAVNSTTLYKNDQARIKEEAKLEITARGDAQFILIDTPASQ